MSATRPWTPPDYSVSGVAGDGWALGNDQRLGALLTFNYSRQFLRAEDGVSRSFNGATGEVANDYRLAFGNNKVTWGSLGSVSYWPSAKHRFTLIGIHTQIADSTGQVVSGFNDDRSADIVSTRLRYVSRSLNFGQLRGEHDFPELASARLEWNAAISGAVRNEPDTRDTVFQSSNGAEYSPPPVPEAGSHLHAEQGERALGGGLDWTQPISREADATKFKVGGLLSVKSRDFKARRFHFGPNLIGPPLVYNCGFTVPRSCPDGLYTPDNIDSGVLLAEEDTTPEDAYKASLDVYAGYAMVDWALTKDLRLIGGARVEATKQELAPYSQVGGNDPPKRRIDATDVLPAVNLAYSVSKRTKLRAAATRTLARPQLRELAPFTFTNYFGAMPIAGNPNLKLTYINNYDTRVEFYPTLREVMAFSFFYKTFKDPIENVVVDSGGGVLMPQNSKGATLEGIELEARKSLDFVAALKDFSLIANLTLAHSKIEIDTSDASPISVTTLSRPLVNQAPYVVNVALDYDNSSLEVGGRVLFNVSGKRIVEVGSKGVPDAYLLPQPSVDLSLHKGLGKHFDVKLTATNLLGSDTIVTIKPTNGNERVMRRHYDGQNLYSDSRVFSLSGSYTY
jgi:outer membrane receptor protein involved in Fe transport